MFSDRIRLYSTILKWLLRLHSSNILYHHITNKGPTWGRPIGEIRRRIQPVCSKEAPTKARGPKEGAAQEGREGSRGLGTMGSLAKGLSHGATYGPACFPLKVGAFWHRANHCVQEPCERVWVCLNQNPPKSVLIYVSAKNKPLFRGELRFSEAAMLCVPQQLRAP